MQKKKGISLIVLVITIIVMIILAGAIIITLNNSGIIDRSSKAVFKQNVKNYQSELGLYLADELSKNPKYDYKTLNADNTTTPSIADVIESIKEEDKTEFIVQNGELVYIGLDENKKSWAEETGIKTQLPNRPLTEAEYNKIYEDEISMALKYGTVTNGTYMLKDEYFIYGGGSSLPEEAYVLALPYETTTVGGACFAMQPITKIILPETTTKVEEYGFAECTNLKEVEGSEYLRNAGTNAFDSVEFSTLKITGTLITSRRLTFNEMKVEKLIIAQGSVEIYAALLEAIKVETVYIPKDITKIGEYAFSETSPTTVYYEGTAEEWTAITIEDGNDPLLNANIIYNYAG